MKILVLNAGSSTQKSCLYEIANALPDTPPEPLWEAKIDWKPDAGMLTVTTQGGASWEQSIPSAERTEGIAQMLSTLYRGETQVLSGLEQIDAVGHRIVHGGEKYREAVRVSPEVVDAIASLIPLAPEHNPVNLEGIEAISQLLPEVMQVAVFDTAFHATIPPAAAIYPLPYSCYEQGIRRYGFHGINHQYCRDRVATLQARLPQRLITCHLGNGASLAAIRNGACIDTTMGFTPLEGLMMGSRSGSIDPGILIHLLRQGYNAESLNRLLNKESGLKGLSGVGNDLREINRAIESGNDRAQLALEVYLHSLHRHIGAMLTSLGGLDTLVFTGGIGENSPLVRSKTCQALEFLGLKLDEAKNEARPVDRDIAAEESAIRVFVLRAREDWAIAKECWQQVGRQSSVISHQSSVGDGGTGGL